MDLSNIEVEINPEYTTMKKVNSGLYLSQEQMDILESFNIDYRRFNNLSDLICEIEIVAEEVDDDVIFNLLDILSERDYYENFKK